MQTETWLIIANGEEISESLLQAIAKNKHLLVCDGAYNRLASTIKIDVLLGDFDSVTPEKLQQARSDRAITVIEILDQSKTDLEKAIYYLDSKGVSNISICNAIGQRADQTLHNLRLLKRMHKAKRKLCIVTDSEIIFYVENSQLTLRGNPGHNVALLGLDKATITTHGLKYDVNEQLLSAAIYENISNELADPEAHINIDGQALVMLNPAIEVVWF